MASISKYDDWSVKMIILGECSHLDVVCCIGPSLPVAMCRWHFQRDCVLLKIFRPVCCYSSIGSPRCFHKVFYFLFFFFSFPHLFDVEDVCMHLQSKSLFISLVTKEKAVKHTHTHIQWAAWKPSLSINSKTVACKSSIELQ